MSRKALVALIVLLVFVMAVVGTSVIAAVKPAPKHPGTHNMAAKTPQEHATAAEHHKKMAAYHKGMAEHHKSMAMEHKKMGHTKLHAHHMAMANSALLSS